MFQEEECVQKQSHAKTWDILGMTKRSLRGVLRIKTGAGDESEADRCRATVNICCLPVVGFFE